MNAFAVFSFVKKKPFFWSLRLPNPHDFNSLGVDIFYLCNLVVQFEDVVLMMDSLDTKGGKSHPRRSTGLPGLILR